MFNFELFRIQLNGEENCRLLWHLLFRVGFVAVVVVVVAGVVVVVVVVAGGGGLVVWLVVFGRSCCIL